MTSITEGTKQFRENIEYIRKETNIPDAWIAQLLGFTTPAGLTNAMRRNNASEVYQRESERLVRGLKNRRNANAGKK